MKTNSTCCADTSCETAIAELPRYYPRQLITPDDLTLEQNYFRDRMRRHNRLLHGWGVVCGAKVCPATTTGADGMISFVPWQVKVEKGYVLGPYGDEIIVDCGRTVDLRTSGVSGVTGEPCIDVPDPWCTQVFVTPTVTTLYIAVKYKQCMTRPVRVQPIGCGCDDTACEYSRWRDGYDIGVLQDCPPCNQVPAPFDPCGDARLTLPKPCVLPKCPDCSCGPWVGLAQVTFDANGTILTIDNCTCRRLVVSLSPYWWICGGSLILKGVASPGKSVPIPVTAGDTKPVTITVTGTNLSTEAIYSFGDGVTVQNPTFTTGPTLGTSVDLTVSAASTASAGKRALRVVNPDCSSGTITDAIEIGLKSPAPAAPAPPAPAPAPGRRPRTRPGGG
jgi:hypothetical protein